MSTSSCSTCGNLFSEGDSVVAALGKSFHSRCFRCHQCDKLLVGEYHAVDGVPLCVRDYRKRYDMACNACGVADTKPMVTVFGKKFHRHCLLCQLCQNPVNGEDRVIAVGTTCVIHFSCAACHQCGADCKAGPLKVIDGRICCQQHQSSALSSTQIMTSQKTHQRLDINIQNIPNLVHVCVTSLMNRQYDFLNEEGLFRVPGDSAKVNTVFKALMNGDRSSSLLENDPHLTCSVLKNFLRKTDYFNSSFSKELRSSCQEAEQGDSSSLYEFLSQPTNLEFASTLGLLVFLLKQISAKSQSNKMTVNNLVTALAPSFFPSLPLAPVKQIFQFLTTSFEHVWNRESLVVFLAGLN